MANILQTACPSCGIKSSNPVISTDPHLYKFSSEADEMLKNRFGKGITYRTHTRKCSKCESIYETAEIAHDTIANLINLVQDLQKEISDSHKVFLRLQARETAMLEYLDYQLDRVLPVENIASVSQPLPENTRFLTGNIRERLTSVGIHTILDLVLYPFDQICKVNGPLNFDEARMLRVLLRATGISVPPPVKVKFPEVDVDQIKKKIIEEMGGIQTASEESLYNGNLTPSQKRISAKKIHDLYKKLHEEVFECQVEVLAFLMLGLRLPYEIKNTKTDEVIIPENIKITKTSIRKITRSIANLEMPSSTMEQFIGYVQNKFSPVHEILKKSYGESMDRLVTV